MSKDPKILAMIERFNYSPQTIGYSELTKHLEQFALNYFKAGEMRARDVVLSNEMINKDRFDCAEAILTDANNRTTLP